MRRPAAASHDIVALDGPHFAVLLDEQPIAVTGGAEELSAVIDRGSVNAFSGPGIHRGCHAEEDAALLEPIIEAHRAVVEAVLPGRLGGLFANSELPPNASQGTQSSPNASRII